MTTDDARAALDAVLPCTHNCGVPDHIVSCPARYRAAVWPIIEKLGAEIVSLTNRCWDTAQKLAAAEAERDRAKANDAANVGDLITLSEKLAQAEALLQRRPHIVVVETTPQAVFEQVHGFTFRTFHEEDTCVRWGGACAK